MWVRTQNDELLNLEHIEYVLVEEADEGIAYELRAYSVGWEPEDDSEFYTLVAAPTDVEASRSMDRLVDALKAADEVIDFRDAPAAQWSTGLDPDA